MLSRLAFRRSARRWASAVLARSCGSVLCAGSFTAPLHARAATPAASAPAGPSVDPPLPKGQERRPLPDYGAPPPNTPWPARLLWLPRILLAPAYVLSDLVSKPVAALVIVAEKHRWRFRLYDFFTFGKENQVGVFPTGRIDTGFDPSVGFYFFWNDVWRASDLRARATTGGKSWWSANAEWRIPFGQRDLAFALQLSKRPDSAFHGLGGKNSSPEAVRFDEQRLELRVRYLIPLAPRLALTTIVGHKWLAYDPDVAERQGTSLAEAIAAGRYAAPPALEGGLVALHAALQLELDTRTGRLLPNPRSAADYAPVSGTGIALSAYLEQHTGLRRTRAEPGQVGQIPAWLTYGAQLVGTLDVTGTQRRLDLELYTFFTEPFPDSGDVPFTEQISLGGSRPLRGFGGRRLLGRSAAVATLRYRWPVWSALDGVLQSALGNVFGPRLRGFDLPELRASFGAGISTASKYGQSFEILLALGTKELRAGAAIENTRLTIGTSANF